MKKSGTLLVSLLFVVSASAFANEDFAAHKQEYMTELDSHISGIQSAKSCAMSAQDREALKKCREILEQAREGWRLSRKAKHKERIDAQIKHLQEEKTKMDQPHANK